MSGPIVGGVITSTIGWEWSFWINVPVIFSSLVISLFLFPEDLTPLTLFNISLYEKIIRLDLLGTILLSSGLIWLVYALQLVSTSPAFTVKEGILFVVSVGLLTLFLVHEYFVTSYIALIPRKLLAVNEVWICCLGSFFLFAGFINYTFFLSIFFQASGLYNL